MQVRLEVDEAQKRPASDTFVSVRIGEWHKQSRLAAAKTHNFPPAACNEPFGRIEIYKRVGVAMMHFGCDNDDVISLDIPCTDNELGNVSMNVVVKRSNLELTPEEQERRIRLQHASIHKYLDNTHFEEDLCEVVQEIVRQRPERPHEGLVQSMLRRGTSRHCLPPLNTEALSLPAQVVASSVGVGTASALPSASQAPTAGESVGEAELHKAKGEAEYWMESTDGKRPESFRTLAKDSQEPKEKQVWNVEELRAQAHDEIRAEEHLAQHDQGSIEHHEGQDDEKERRRLEQELEAEQAVKDIQEQAQRRDSNLKREAAKRQSLEEVPLRLQVTVVSASGLRAVGPGESSDPYVVCLASGTPLFQTNVVRKSLNPNWGFETTIEHDPGTALEFAVWDRDDALFGKVGLAPDDLNNGFEGQLALSETGLQEEGTATITLKVKPLPRGSDSIPMKAVVHVKRAVGLRSADDNGFSDPYVIGMIPGKPESYIKTRTQFRTLNPVWDEVDEVLDYEPGDMIRFMVWDQDFGISDDDSLGFCVLTSDQLSPDGFDGDLKLNDAVGQHGEGGEDAALFLSVRLVPL